MPAIGDASLATHLVGHTVLREAASVLGRSGIAVMPLKGIWLQHLVYTDPSQRPITDVDVIVPEAQWREAIACLQGAGWQLRNGNVSEVSLIWPALPMPLDLHCRLFSRHAFALPTQDLFDRSTLDTGPFEVQLQLPDPRDMFAHIVGHFVKSRGSAERRYLQDLANIARVFSLQPTAVARHLQRCGMRRAARYVLSLAATMEADAFCRDALRALDPDPVGMGLVAVALRMRARVGASSPLGALPGFVLEPSLGAGIRSFAYRWMDRRHDWRL